MSTPWVQSRVHPRTHDVVNTLAGRGFEYLPSPRSLVRMWLVGSVVAATGAAGIAYTTLRWLASVAEITADITGDDD